MKVLLIGAHGKIGQLVAQKMSASDKFEPTAFIRKEKQKGQFDDLGVPVIVESLENSKEAIAKKIKGFDAVVFAAGSGGSTGFDKTLEVDLFGAIKVMDAAKENGIERFVMVSAAYADQPEKWSDAMRPYYIAKHLADRELKNSGLDYTILRPVRLTDDEEAGKIMIQSEPDGLNTEIPRAAVVETILQVLKDDSAKGKILDLSAGSMAIEEAVAEFV